MLNFFQCSECDSVMLEMPHTGKTCNNEQMNLLKTNANPDVAEMHVPIVTIEDGEVVVRIGAKEHPMLDEHYIEWVIIQTSAGGTYVHLQPGDPPVVRFPINPEGVEAVYLHCNIHGLWKADEPVFPNFFDQNTVACSPEFAQGCLDPSEDPLG